MVKISQKVKNQLKKPLGSIEQDFSKLKKLSANHRIIAVGDVCTLCMLAIGIKPHLAVFDHKFMRQPLDKRRKDILTREFTNPEKYKNEAGTL
ncbi:hypothetical protein HZC07_05255 [Candidatus Micrarchaeota archaeon]|nr:hypothetical protein [Candidatus Micrarchaeota archaeon]